LAWAVLEEVTFAVADPEGTGLDTGRANESPAAAIAEVAVAEGGRLGEIGLAEGTGFDGAVPEAWGGSVFGHGGQGTMGGGQNPVLGGALGRLQPENGSSFNRRCRRWPGGGRGGRMVEAGGVERVRNPSKSQQNAGFQGNLKGRHEGS